LIALSLLAILYGKNQKPEIIISPFVLTKSPTPYPTISLIAVGDIMLGRNVNVKMQKYQNFNYPFEKTAAFLSSADLTFGNLESPFFDQCPIVGSGTFVFCADYQAIEGLKLAGFDILSLENNHLSNYGKAGIDQTQKLLLENQISFSDSNNLTIKQFNQTSFGFLSFNLTFGLDSGNILKKVRENLGKTDPLIVSLHWGEEYKTKPAAWQVELAHELIDLGVRVILGHHSHWIGEIEEYKNGLIFYSLGNFVFDQMWSQETREGLVVKITFENKNIKDFQTYNVLISDYSQPDFIKND